MKPTGQQTTDAQTTDYGISADGVRRGESQTNVKRFYYDTYGNVNKVEEFDGWPNQWPNPTTLTTLRTTVTDYALNVHLNSSATFITAAPARSRVYAGTVNASNCKAETRTIYWDPDSTRNASNNKEGNYQSAPWSLLPRRFSAK